MGLGRALGAVGVGLLAAAALWIGIPGFLFQEGATVQSLSVDEVVLNDELAGDVPAGESGAGVCAGGPPPDHFLVGLALTLDDADSGRFVDSETYRIVVGIGAHTGAREVTVVDGARRRVEATLFVEDDDSLDAGERASVEVSLVHEGETRVSLTQEAPVAGRDPDCDTEGA